MLKPNLPTCAIIISSFEVLLNPIQPIKVEAKFPAINNKV